MRLLQFCLSLFLGSLAQQGQCLRTSLLLRPLQRIRALAVDLSWQELNRRKGAKISSPQRCRRRDEATAPHTPAKDGSELAMSYDSPHPDDAIRPSNPQPGRQTCLSLLAARISGVAPLSLDCPLKRDHGHSQQVAKQTCCGRGRHTVTHRVDGGVGLDQQPHHLRSRDVVLQMSRPRHVNFEKRMHAQARFPASIAIAMHADTGKYTERQRHTLVCYAHEPDAVIAGDVQGRVSWRRSSVCRNLSQ